MKKNILLLLLPFFLACSPQTRLNRLLTRHPELIQQAPAKIVIDTFYVQSRFADTVFNWSATEFKTLPGKIDTFYMEKNGISLQAIMGDSTLKINASTAKDTFYKVQQIPVPFLKVETLSIWKMILSTWWLILIGLSLGLAGVAILRK